MIAPVGVAQFLEHQFQHLEVVVLLVAHDVDHVVELIVLEAAESRAEVLRHVDRRAVAAQQQFLVQSVGREVDPHRIVGTAVEDTLFKPLLDERLAQQVGLRLVIDLVEIDAQRLVGHVEALVNPAVHRLPERVHLGVPGLPLAQHLLRLEHDRGVFLGLVLRLSLRDQLPDLRLVVFVELHVVLAHEVIALHHRRCRGFAVSVELPRQHRLADVDAAVVHQIGLDDRMAVGLENLRHGVTQQVVADMPQMERLVGVGRRILDHHGTARRGSLPETFVGGDLGEAGRPERAVERKVEETFDHVERRDLGDVGRHVFADFGRGGFGRLAASPEQRKGYEGIVALELPAGLLNLQLLVAKLTVKRLHRPADRIRNKGFDIHIQ